MEIRRRALSDSDAAARLGAEAFGGPVSPPPAAWPPPNVDPWGTFDGDELVAQASVRDFTSWFHGHRVATAGVASVTVAPERRGDGLLGDLMAAALVAARDRGAVISTLYPTAPGIYRPSGYELVGTLQTIEVPTAELARVRRPDGVRLRRATSDDVPAIRECYAPWAAAFNGPLAREHVPFLWGADATDDYTGVTLALSGGELLGYAAWTRGTGYDPDHATLEVDELVGLTAEGNRALCAVLGSFASVVGRVRLHSSAGDPARLVLPGIAWREVRQQPYMLRLLDVSATLEALPVDVLGSRLPGSGLRFSVRDERPLRGLDVSGSWVLRVADGEVRCLPEAGRADVGQGPVFTAAGLALLYAGSQSPAALRLAGHLTGPADDDATWQALCGGRSFQIRDYF